MKNEQAEQSVQNRVRAIVRGFRSGDLAAAQAACDQAAAAESEALAILQEPISLEDPHRHEGARSKLVKSREDKQRAQSSLRAARAAADAAIAVNLQPLHSEVWQRVEQSVAALSAAVGNAEEFKNAAGGAADGFFFGGLNQLTAIRHQLTNVTTLWRSISR
ncbi:MAG: hypothetical protein ACK56E_21695 [Planctomyces sp.]|jgi:hypothetical protein